MGAGSVGVASVELGRQFHGNDLSANAVAITSERLVAAMRASDEREPGKTTR
jgi:hypothetical protein